MSHDHWHGGVGLLASVSNSPVIEGQGEIRVKPDGLVEALNGAIGLAHRIVGSGPVIKSFGVIRVELDGLVVIRNGAVGLALAKVGITPVVERYG